WKGGPPLRGEPGTPEFTASYNAATSAKRSPPDGKLVSLLMRFQSSDEFLRLAPETQRGYGKALILIEREFRDFPIAALTDRRSRAVFMEWRDRIALRSRRQADYCWTVLARVLSWALDRGLAPANPCSRGGRLYRANRVDKVWTEQDEATFLARAPAHLHLPLMLALWTGQRQGDLLRLSWGAYDGTHIRLHQSKRGRRVVIPVGALLKAWLDRAPRISPVILTNRDGRPWRSNVFQVAWGVACKRVGITGLTFHDLRGTAVTRLALAGCTEAEIAAITGHSLRSVHQILDAHYLSRDPALGESAIKKLEKRTNFPNRLPTERP
ncbi:MAG TPA: tyrosine-type recombinase/integrase, partial [Xanthobacteraceae bacterium]|nr:tyrosine-type recombinase/integrase [Xanthobacteraceae bacterium]